MFGKISDKTKRKAYLDAVAQKRSEFLFEQNVENAKKSENLEEKKKALVANREILSGKDASLVAKKELKLTNKKEDKAIIGNKLANMKYYKDWRSRIDSEILKEPISNTDEDDNFDFDDDYEPFKTEKSAGGASDNFEREPGIASNSATNLENILKQNKHRSSKDYFDFHFPSATLNTKSNDVLASKPEKKIEAKPEIKFDTKQALNFEPKSETQKEEDVDTLFEKLFAKFEAGHNLAEPEFEDSLENEPMLPAMEPKKIKMAGVKKSTANKKPKKKKIDTDIVGSAGFFTLS